MRYEIVLASEAVEDLRALEAAMNAAVKDRSKRIFAVSPAGVLIGFKDDWFDYRLSRTTRGFSTGSRKPRASLRAGRGVRLEDA
jgi:hypothetical protein